MNREVAELEKRNQGKMKIEIEKDFNRPWGGFIKFIDNKPCTVKILQIKRGECLSLQSHKLRDEFWYIVAGEVKVTFGENLKSLKSETLTEDQYSHIPKNVLHRA